MGLWNFFSQLGHEDPCGPVSVFHLLRTMKT